MKRCYNLGMLRKTDRSDLILHDEGVSDYVKLVIHKLVKLTVHSYISKCQSINITKVFGDFTENYSSVL